MNLVNLFQFLIQKIYKLRFIKIFINKQTKNYYLYKLGYTFYKLIHKKNSYISNKYFRT